MWQRPAVEVRSTRAPDSVFREEHPTVCTFSNKQRVHHLLVRAIIVWKGPTTAHKEGELQSDSTYISSMTLAGSKVSEGMSVGNTNC